MDNNYPLFPDLPEEGEREAQRLIDKFRESLLESVKAIAEKAMFDLYADIIPHIQSDSWTNYRNHLMDGFKNYSNRKIQGAYDFKEIRQAIFKEFREDIIVDLDQDLVEENKDLKAQLQQAWNRRR